jgi:hypothetical protein
MRADMTVRVPTVRRMRVRVQKRTHRPSASDGNRSTGHSPRCTGLILKWTKAKGGGTARRHWHQPDGGSGGGCRRGLWHSR